MPELHQRGIQSASKFLPDFFKNDAASITAIFLILFIFKAIFAVFHSTGPAILNDEYLYKFNAESIFLLQKYASAHYPPVYSLTLAPALFFDNWYEAMLVINAFLSSLLIPAVWSLAKAAEMRHPMVPTTLAAFIPFHAVYPSFLLSENLFVPLFCCALALCLRGKSKSPREGMLFGVILGLTHLTKYLFLPAVPLLYLGWLWGLRHPRREQGGDCHGRPPWPRLLPISPSSVSGSGTVKPADFIGGSCLDSTSAPRGASSRTPRMQ